MTIFKKAEREQLKLKMAITGPSGSGKTYSALRLAKGLGGKVAVIDTENGSASLYSDRFEFDVLELSPPYTNEKYLAAIKEAETAKYDTVIIDSLTHQWAGEGGLLNKKEQLDARGGNSFANWAKMTPEHERFKSAILHANINVIGTMRSKTEYVLSENEKGKQVPKKMGLAPIQRDGMEYEFTTVLDISMNHEAQASKDRTGLFIGQMFQITEETGKKLQEWISQGRKKEVVEPTQPAATSRKMVLARAADKNGWTLDEVKVFMKDFFNQTSADALSEVDYLKLFQMVSVPRESSLVKKVQIPVDSSIEPEPDFKKIVAPKDLDNMESSWEEHA